MRCTKPENHKFPNYTELGNVLGLSKGGAKARFYRLKSYFESVSSPLEDKPTSPKKRSPVKLKDGKGLKEFNDWSEDECKDYLKLSSEEPLDTPIKMQADADIKPEFENDGTTKVEFIDI